MANQHNFDLTKRRRNELDRKKRKSLKISNEVCLFVVAYARERNLFQQKAADELLRIGIKNVYFKEPRDNLTSGKIMKFIRRKGAAPGKTPNATE